MRLLAVVALLMHASWPFVGQLRAAEPTMAQVVCSVHGTMLVPAEEEPPATSRASPCFMCSAVSASFLPSHHHSFAAQAASRGEPRVDGASAPPKQAFHGFPSSRAPPQAS